MAAKMFWPWFSARLPLAQAIQPHTAASINLKAKVKGAEAIYAGFVMS